LIWSQEEVWIGEMYHMTTHSAHLASDFAAKILMFVKGQGSFGYRGHKVHLTIIRKRDEAMEATIPVLFHKRAQTRSGLHGRLQKHIIGYLRGAKRPQMQSLDRNLGEIDHNVQGQECGQPTS
jgi:hypothetical protein